MGNRNNIREPRKATLSRTNDDGARLFISYSHADDEHRKRLELHLASLRREGLIAPWHDRMIPAGTEWAATIDRNLAEADIVLLLVSADFVASDYCFDKELQLALERRARGEAMVIPVFVEPTDFAGLPFAKLQGLPRDGKPVSMWANRDEAWLDVVKGIRSALCKLVALAPAGSPQPPAVPAPQTPAEPSASGEKQSQLIGSDANRPAEATAERICQITHHLRNWVEAPTPEAKLNEAESLVADVEMAVMMVRSQARGYEALLRSLKALVEQQRAALQAEIDSKRTALAQRPRGFTTDNLDRHLAEKMLQFAIRSRQNDIDKLDTMMGPLAVLWGKLV